MSDDEEIVLQSSELHKYFISNNSGNLITTVDCERNNSNYTPRTELNYQNCESKLLENRGFNISCKKPELCWHTAYLIDVVLKTGLMYPDHVADVEIYLNTENIKSQPFICKTAAVFYSTSLFCSFASVLLCKRFRIFRYVSILAGSVYFTFKIYNDLTMFYERKKVKRLAYAIEHLFSVTKRAMSFIFESEFLLKTKMVKEQPIYVPDHGWVNANTKEGLSYCGLLLPEFRSILAEVFFCVAIAFDKLSGYMRTVLNLLPHVDCDNYCTQLPDDNTLYKISVNPSLEDLKKLNSVYLIAQSEFLRRLIFSFVKDYWCKSNSHGDFKDLMNRVSSCTDKFLWHANILESFYQRCIKANKNKNVQIERNKVLKAGNSNDKLFIFARNFLTKADAHLLSLSLDLKMLDSWINDCEENNDDSKKLLTILQDRFVIMKSNIELLACLYNDNCNIFKTMINTKSLNDDVDGLSNTDVKSSESECVLKTGIEVGKSDFDFNGEDEVLISLSNIDISNCEGKLQNHDYEDEEIKKCLPKNVLLELKCALKGKKEEWIEREKKALKSDVSIDSLDFDTLSNIAVENHVSERSSCKITSRTKYSYESESSSDDEANSLLSLKEMIDESKCNEFNSNALDSTPKIENKFTNFCQSIGNLNSCESRPINNSVDTSISKNVCSNFVDQIKFAQKSFNLSMKEEEFIDSSSDGDDDHADV